MRVIARLLGKISSSFVGVLKGRMHYRKLERFKMLALARNRSKYETKISLSVEAIEDIWWRDHILDTFAPIVRPCPDSIISTDACEYGWGTCWEGKRTGGQYCHSNQY